MNETSPASGPATPPVPSPHIATVATPTPIFSHVSPAYAEPQPMTDEVYTAVKQEHDVDQIMESESVDRAHLRHDSHLGSHGTPVESPMETKLPSISTWQMPETLAQIPATRPYDPIFSRTSPMHNSPLMDPSSSPPARYHSGSINGNEHQTVMMSPSTMLPPLQPSFHMHRSTGSSLISLFDRPQSRPNGSSPER